MEISEVKKILEEEEVKFIDLWFTDMVGVIKNVTIPVKYFEKAVNDGIWFDGSSIEGFGRICESDMYLKPDLSTLRILPWTDGTLKTAMCICDVYSASYEPFTGDPRFVLRRAMDYAKRMGFTYMVGAELEFFLFEKKEGEFTPVMGDGVGYFDLEGDRAHTLRKKISFYLKEMGIEAETSHHEVSPGQHEIDIKYSDALTMADSIIISRMVVRKVAEDENYIATFMPKPVFGINGSGMHLHQSLFTDGENVFANPEDRYGLSSVAYRFLAGQLKKIKEITLVLNPTVNSYKRLVAGYEAPVYICWGRMNRSALIRIPRISRGRPQSTRLELRSPDPSANPYLALACMLRAGLYGIENNLSPGEPAEEDVYRSPEGMDTLPGSLIEAIEVFRESRWVKEILGDYLFERYLDIKLKEWEDYRIRVTRWEIEKYLGRY